MAGKTRGIPEYKDGGDHRLTGQVSLASFKSADFQSADRQPYTKIGQLLDSHFEDRQVIIDHCNSLGANIQLLELNTLRDLEYQKTRISLEYATLADGEAGTTYYVFYKNANQYNIIGTPLTKDGDEPKVPIVEKYIRKIDTTGTQDTISQALLATILHTDSSN